VNLRGASTSIADGPTRLGCRTCLRPLRTASTMSFESSALIALIFSNINYVQRSEVGYSGKWSFELQRCERGKVEAGSKTGVRRNLRIAKQLPAIIGGSYRLWASCRQSLFSCLGKLCKRLWLLSSQVGEDLAV